MTFIKRSISAVLLTIVVVLAFTFGGYFLAACLLAVSLIGFWELSKAMANPPLQPGEERRPLPNKKKFDYMDAIGMVGIVLYYAAMVFLNNPVYQFVAVILVIVGILFVYVFSYPNVTIDRIADVAFSFIYCPVLLSFVYMTREQEENGGWLVWLILISSWGCDTFAYLFGRSFGKTKVFPKLSPNKSLAGCIGGVLSSGVMGAAYGYYYVNKITGQSWMFIFVAIACMVGAVMGMIGDLVASGIKRNKGFKDYAKLIPGHGGIMDRFDSTVVTAIAVYALSLVITKM